MKLYLIVSLTLIIASLSACNSEKSASIPYELDRISIPENGIKIVIVDSTFKVMEKGEIIINPPNMEIGISDIPHHFPEYSFKINSSGVTYISQKQKHSLKKGINEVSEAYYIDEMCMCHFSINDKLVILQKMRLNCNVIKRK